jgi:hypothetical protein
MGSAPNSAEIHYLTVGPGSHNAEVEGSSPSLTTTINELQLLNCGNLRDFAGLRRTNPSALSGASCPSITPMV